MIQQSVPPEVADELSEIGKFAAANGWVPATSGNFSRRIDTASFAITRSGANKGDLRADSFIAVPLDGPLPPGVSAETPLHRARYRADPGVGAVVHVHSVAATVLSRLDVAAGSVVLDGFEMHKALAGISSHEGQAVVPIFPNSQDTQALAGMVEERLGAKPQVPGYLLSGHGLYAWGSTTLEARRHLEGLEFLLRCALEERKVR